MHVLQVLSGHEGPISCLSFSSTAAMLASGSWDKTVKLWDVFENKGSKETLNMSTDGRCCKFCCIHYENMPMQ